VSKAPSWTLQVRKLSDLIPHPKNPRQILAEDQKHLAVSMDKFGLIDKPIINLDNMLIGGHQRVYTLQLFKVDVCECWVPDRMLSPEEADELNIRLNRNQGEWDYDILGNEWDLESLVDYGFDPKELGVETKPKKAPKVQIVFEFADKDTMLNALEKLESVNNELGATMKVRG